MLLPKPMRITSLSCLVCVLITIAGCASLKPEPTYIVVKPKVAPLSKTVLQAMQPNSTELLQKADSWLQNSGQLLDSVTSP